MSDAAVNYDKLIDALIQVESGGRADAFGDQGRSLGCLQIGAAVIFDVNVHFKKTYSLQQALRPVIAREICRLYLQYWGCHYNAYRGRLATYGVLARIWNGGPTGWNKSATLPYWDKVRKALAS